MPIVKSSSGLLSGNANLSADNTWTGINTYDDQVQWSIGSDVEAGNNNAELPGIIGGNYADVVINGILVDITSFATTGHAGTIIRFHFPTGITLKHSDFLELPASADLITVENDELTFIEHEFGKFRCTAYSLASGSTVAGVNSIGAGTNVNVDDTNPQVPIVSLPTDLTSQAVNSVTLADTNDSTIFLNGDGGYTIPPGTGLTAVVDDTSPELGGVLDSNSRLIAFSKGSTVTSVTSNVLTIPINGNSFILNVDGTPTINELEFDPSLSVISENGIIIQIDINKPATFAHQAFNIDIPGGQDLLVANGDVLIFVVDSGIFDLISLQRDATLVTISDDTAPDLGGRLDTDGNLVAVSQGTTITTISGSPASITIPIDGNYFLIDKISGGTDIENMVFDGALSVTSVAGIRVSFEIAETVLTFKHLSNSGNIELPGGLDIVAQLEDVLEFRTKAGPAFELINIQRADSLSTLSDDPAPRLGGPLDPDFNIIAYDQGSGISASSNLITIPIDGNTFAIDLNGEIIDQMEMAANNLVDEAGIFFNLRVTGVSPGGTFRESVSPGNISLPGGNDVVVVSGDILEFLIQSDVFFLLNIQRGDSLSTLSDDPAPSLSGVLDTDGNLVQLSRGADLTASAGVLTIGVDGNSFDVTNAGGNISSIADSGVDGTEVEFKFTGVLDLIDSGNLTLPGGADITTANGDDALFIQLTDSQWKCIRYTKADGTAVRQTYELIAEVTASASTNIDFISLLDTSKFTYWMIEASGFNPTDSPGDRLAVRVGDGASFHITNYSFFTTSGKAASTSNVTDTSITATLGRMGALDTAFNNISNTFTMKITHNTSQNRVSLTWDGYFVTLNVPVGTGARAGRMSGSVFCSNTTQTSIRFLWEGGTTFAKGNFRLYGIR